MTERISLVQSIFRGDTEIFVEATYEGGKVTIKESWDDDAFLTLSEDEAARAALGLLEQIGMLGGY